jgi:hypothetical protein
MHVQQIIGGMWAGLKSIQQIVRETSDLCFACRKAELLFIKDYSTAGCE